MARWWRLRQHAGKYGNPLSPGAIGEGGSFLGTTLDQTEWSHRSGVAAMAAKCCSDVRLTIVGRVPGGPRATS